MSLSRADEHRSGTEGCAEVASNQLSARLTVLPCNHHSVGLTVSRSLEDLFREITSNKFLNVLVEMWQLRCHTRQARPIFCRSATMVGQRDCQQSHVPTTRYMRRT